MGVICPARGAEDQGRLSLGQVVQSLDQLSFNVCKISPRMQALKYDLRSLYKYNRLKLDVGEERFYLSSEVLE